MSAARVEARSTSPASAIVYLNACPEIPDDLLLAHELLHASARCRKAHHTAAPTIPVIRVTTAPTSLWPTAGEIAVRRAAPGCRARRLLRPRRSVVRHPRLRCTCGASESARRSVALALRGARNRHRAPFPVSIARPRARPTGTCAWTFRCVAAPAAGRRFIRWEGACAGRAACVVSLRGARIDVGAVFAAAHAAPGARGRRPRRARGRAAVDVHACVHEAGALVHAGAAARSSPRRAGGCNAGRAGCRGTTPTCVVPMERATQVKVVFVRAPRVSTS